MQLTLQDKTKISILEAIFQLLKNASSLVQFEIFPEYLRIEGMDKSHVCLFKIQLASSWFAQYNVDKKQSLSLDTTVLYTILAHVNSDTLLIKYDDENEDILNIDLLCNEIDKAKGSFDRFFSIPLIDSDFEVISIPEMEYDAEFKLECKKLQDLTSQLILFGSTLNIICNENGIDLKTIGDNGTMKVNLPIDDLSEFSISEGEELEISYSLNYIHKMCLTTKLCKEVQVSISENLPICIKYDLEENSSVLFYVAPKI